MLNTGYQALQCTSLNQITLVLRERPFIRTVLSDVAVPHPESQEGPLRQPVNSNTITTGPTPVISKVVIIVSQKNLTAPYVLLCWDLLD